VQRFSAPWLCGGRSSDSGQSNRCAADECVHLCVKGTPDGAINPPIDAGDAAAQPSEPAAGTKNARDFLGDLQLPKWVLRTIAALVLMGQVTSRIIRGRIHWKNTLQQLQLVGPRSLGVALLTAGFVGMVFTIQVLYSLPIHNCVKIIEPHKLSSDCMFSQLKSRPLCNV
jgi:hypothetical protein